MEKGSVAESVAEWRQEKKVKREEKSICRVVERKKNDWSERKEDQKYKEGKIEMKPLCVSFVSQGVLYLGREKKEREREVWKSETLNNKKEKKKEFQY